MKYLQTENRQVFRGSGGPHAPVIYVIDSPEHPLELADAARNRSCTIVTLPALDWDESLTPWPAPALYRGNPDFGGKADQTLAELCDEAIPTIEREEGLAPTRRAICGYSLGGLFALYALTHGKGFAACACLSGSVWYEGWVEHLQSLGFDGTGTFAYLSVGTKEKRAAQKILKSVQERMEQCAGILQECGCETVYRTGPGNHLQHIPERLDAGLSALEEFLARQNA